MNTTTALVICVAILALCLIITIFALTTTTVRKHKWKKRSQQIFFISDTHFGNRHQARRSPFKSVRLMNLVIRNNWNRKVSRRDKVYVLGDFADHGFHFWQNKLNGEKVIFKGKSERSGKQSEIITLGNKQFYLTYKPDNVPSGYNGWAITGYIHGANMVNVGRKLFCVTAKTLHYSPINATEVIRLVNKAEAELGS